MTDSTGLTKHVIPGRNAFRISKRQQESVLLPCTMTGKFMCAPASEAGASRAISPRFWFLHGRRKDMVVLH